jgi:HK97 family phage major capsid protein
MSTAYYKQDRRIEPTAIRSAGKVYSVANAIRAAAGIGDGGYEWEVSQEMKRSLSGSGIETHGGLLIPTNTRAGLDTKTATKGQELVFTTPGPIIEGLRARSLVLRMGATFLPGLVGGPVGLAGLGPGVEPQWIPENPASAPADIPTPDTKRVTLTAKTLSATVAFSRQLLTQSTPEVDQLLVDDIGRANAAALDKAALHGSGTDSPQGIFTLASNLVAFAGPISEAKLCDLEFMIADDNGETGQLGFITTPKVRRDARKTNRGTGINDAIWSRDDRMLSYPAGATKNCPENLGAGSEHGLVLGSWQECVIGEWGLLEVLEDRTTQKKRGMIELSTFLYCDVQFRHLESFAVSSGLTVSA